MSLQRETIESTIKLSKLQFEQEEKEAFVETLQEVVDLVETLDEVNVEGVKSTYNGIDLVNVLREDEPKKEIPREAFLNNAKTTQDGYIQVPAMIVENEEGGA